MSEVVVKVDFGKQERINLRRFMRLMGLQHKFEQEVLADPIYALNRASERVASLSQTLDRARDAWRGRHGSVGVFDRNAPEFETIETVTVPRQDWEALQKMRAIIDEGAGP